MIYLAIAVLILHLLSMPIVVGATVYVDTDDNAGMFGAGLYGIPVFSKKMDVERIKKRLSESDEYDEKHDDGRDAERKEKSGGTGRFKRFLIELARQTAKRIRVRNVEFKSIIGTGDAAADAVSVGAMRIMYSQACAFFGLEGTAADVRPDYDNARIYIYFVGIFSLCFSDIIVAVCAVLFNKLTHRTAKRSEKHADTVTE